jgi:hypothetical protein
MDDKMTAAIGADRLKSFSPADLRRSDSDRERYDAAQDAGIALKRMRKSAGYRLGTLADLLGMPTEDLKKAEAGQLVGDGKDGRLIDFPAALLVRVARLTKQKHIPLP